MPAELERLRRLSSLLEDIGAGAFSSHIDSAVAEIEARRAAAVGANVGTPPAPKAMMMCDDMPSIARRIRIDLHTPVERAIHDAMHAVERAGADARLTKAITLLAEAKDEVSDFMEAQPGFTCISLQAGSPLLDAENTAGLSGLSDAVRYAIQKQANDIVGLWAPGNRRLEQEIVRALIQRERRLVIHGGPTIPAYNPKDRTPPATGQESAR